jgi:hypothetical protein
LFLQPLRFITSSQIAMPVTGQSAFNFQSYPRDTIADHIGGVRLSKKRSGDNDTIALTIWHELTASTTRRLDRPSSPLQI